MKTDQETEATSNEPKVSSESNQFRLDDQLVYQWYPDLKTSELRESSLPLFPSVDFFNEKGLLRVTFNKLLIIPLHYENLQENFEDEKFDDQVKDLLQMSVYSDFYEQGSKEIAIKNYSLVDFTTAHFDILIEFQTPGLLSQSVLEADTL